MSRSIHTTFSDYWREQRFGSTDTEAKEERLAAIRERLETKRRIKSQVRGERERIPFSHLPPAKPDAIPIEVAEQSDWIHYPASPDDLRAVMRLLPHGVFTGLASIRLCLGREIQEEDLTSDERAEAGRDPWLGRVGSEVLPGVFGGRCLGSYGSDDDDIELYAYLYDPELPERRRWELFLRLRMLATFVHEVAHHDDDMRRIGRGRWRADDVDKTEAFAEASAAHWVRECVVPYLEEAYPDAVRELNAWIEHHGGTAIPLALLGGDWGWDSNGKAVSVYLGSVRQAFESLADDVHEGREPTATRLAFARRLLYGNCAEALRVIERVLSEEPANLEALTLLADVLRHLGEYQSAETLARQVLEVDERYLYAWMVLTNTYEAQRDWTNAIVAADRGMACTKPGEWKWDALLENRARANLELGHYASVMTDLEMLPESYRRDHIAAPLQALVLLRTGIYEEAFLVADSHLSRKSIPRGMAVLTAVRFEAARKLGRSTKRGELSAAVLSTLRRLHHDEWVDRLVAEYAP